MAERRAEAELLGRDTQRDGAAARRGPQGRPELRAACLVPRESGRTRTQKVVELARLAREATVHLRNSELLGKGRDSFVRLAGGAVTQAGVAINHIRNSEVLGRGRTADRTNAEESDEEPPALVQVEAGEPQVRETAYESDADTLCDDDDREWDIVDTSATAGEETIAETDGEWAHELDVIRDILVRLDEELCCDLLGQYNGDVEAVLVELTNK
ncbi:hypothetical protein GQ600_4013 [Phytophthora cactorum]|nr:hypothetical protein GQ600_4013 [Phytophthora cactorum]